MSYALHGTHDVRALSRLMLKLTALLSACGGPMVVADALEPKLGGQLSFIIGFTPVALATLGTFALTANEHDTPARLFVGAGLAGVASISAMNLYGVVRLMSGPSRADANLIVVGMIVGAVATIGYLSTYQRWRRESAAAHGT